MKNLKCSNCGANLEFNDDKRMQFCPYCGYALPLPEDAASLEKFKLKHQEEVRQRKHKEDQLQIYIGIGLMILLLISLSVFPIFR